MDFIEKIYRGAKRAKKKIIMPEGETLRVLKAISTLLKKEICLPVILGDPKKIQKSLRKEGININGTEIIDSGSYNNLDKYIALYCEIRKHKEISEDEARKLITQNPVFYAALGVRAGDFDGLVAGASITTRDVARAAIYCIGPDKDTPVISSSIIMIFNDKSLGSNGVFIFADAGVIPDPTAEQLCDIAIASAKMARVILDDEPKVAMLSYSTKGSGAGQSVEKVKEATRLVSEKMPGLLIDGEIQVDCAVVPEVANRKDPDSRIKGRANVFIFPNLDAGNISYKIAERFAKAHALGPVLQGLRKPASDLSRGCDTQDIIDTVAITAFRAQDNKG
ncbi:MAG: phosphate acetyltransferase [Candidatus Omnitrophica bacterium]|nr:phosphate acetyltransferase [Candidatus Omnitrophota bacterium]